MAQILLTKNRRQEQRMVAEAHRKLAEASPEFAIGIAWTLRWVEDDQNESAVLLEPPAHAGKHQSMEHAGRPRRTGRSTMNSSIRVSLTEIGGGISF
jgi:hypothetical protein